MTTGPAGTKVRTTMPSSTRAMARLDHRAIQHSVILLKLPLLAQPHHSQHGGHRPFAGREQRPDHHHLGVGPHALRQQGRELYNQLGQGDRHGQHSPPILAQEWAAAYRPVALLSKHSSLDKVQLSSTFADLY